MSARAASSGERGPARVGRAARALLRGDDDKVSLRALRLYVGIVVLYVALMGWWLVFFATQGERIVKRLEWSGAGLDEDQAQAVRVATNESLRMLVFEGTFLGLLVLGSVWLVLRAMRREIVMHRQQRNFLSAVTHELKSPLASARLYLESILLGRTDAAKTERYLRHAKEDLDRLASRVDDILLARRLQQAAAALELGVVDLAELASRAVGHLAPLHEQDGVKVRLDARGPVLLKGDVAALEQVLENLLSNAVKYGQGQPVDVSVHQQGDRAVLQVRDHGKGLQGADPAALMAPFVRGLDERVRTNPGVGLGLYIVRELVAAHGGTVELREPEEGGGLAVTVELPAASAEELAEIRGRNRDEAALAAAPAEGRA